MLAPAVKKVYVAPAVGSEAADEAGAAGGVDGAAAADTAVGKRKRGGDEVVAAGEAE